VVLRLGKGDQMSNIRQKIRNGEVILTAGQFALLKKAGSSVVEKRVKSGPNFDLLVSFGLIRANGKLTIEGGRTLRVLKRKSKLTKLNS
jgi:hypothetical protein